MGRKAENTRKIKELEEELSLENIAELFRIDEDGINNNEGGRARYGRKFTARRLIVILLIVLGFTVALQYVTPMVVNERSMEDTIGPNDLVLIAIRAYDRSEVEFGDLILMQSRIVNEEGVMRDLTKRVIGLPGDIIEIKNSGVYRNGELLDEPYTRDGITDGEMEPSQVPWGSYFVMGDNRLISIDSRDARIGFVEYEQIIGKVVFRLLPFSKFGVLR